MWRIRLARECPRYLVCGLALVGLTVSARDVVAPPVPVIERPPMSHANSFDRPAEGYAVLFARRYLTWNAADPQATVQSLELFTGQGMEADVGLNLPDRGEQQVLWAEVVQAREPERDLHVYTVAAQTDAAGLLYVTVSVLRSASGALTIAGYPALVGAPATAPAAAQPRMREVDAPGLATVVERALRNYLADASGELAADLSPGARVSLPSLALRLASVQHLSWSTNESSVLAVVDAEDGRGVQYTLAYEIDVLRAQGRWEISAVQTDPDA